MLRKAIPFLVVFLFALGTLAQEPEKESEALDRAIDQAREDVKAFGDATEETADEAKPVEKAEEQPKEAIKQEEASEEASEIEETPEKVPDVLPIEKEEEAKKQEKVKEGREILLSPAIHGQTGLFRIYSAQRMPASLKNFSFSLHGEWFTKKNFIAVGDEISRWRSIVAMTYAPIEYVEIFTSIFAFTNTGKQSGTLTQRMGDLRAGLKLGVDLGSFMSLGTSFGAEIMNGAGDLNITSNAYSYDLRGLATFDFSKTGDLPIRLHLNAGYRWDGTINPTGAALLTATDRFFLDIIPGNQATFGLAFEVPVEFLSLFVEYTLEKVKGFSFGNSPQRLTAGVKVFPTKEQNLTFDVGTDMRLLNSSKTARAIGVPDYNIIFGMTFSHLAKAPELKEVAPVSTGKLVGTVIDPDTSTGVGAAEISFDDGVHNTIISKETGDYLTGDLPVGIQNITVSKEGYAPLKVSPTIVPGQTTTVDFVLSKLKFKKGSVIFQVYDADDKPLTGTVQFLDFPKLKPYRVDTARGGLKVKLKEGTYKVRVDASKYAAEEKAVDVEGGKEVTDKTRLREEVQKVIIQKDKIVIKDKIHFASGKSEIRTDSLSLLNRVADLISDHKEIKKVRIEGYTDSVGAAEFNLRLSQKRAEAVKEYLVIRGIEDQRLEAVGYGEVNPIAPNSTKQGRAINRRVEFTILGG